MTDDEAAATIVDEFVEWAARRGEIVKADLRAIARRNPDAAAETERQERQIDEALDGLREATRPLIDREGRDEA